MLYPFEQDALLEEEYQQKEEEKELEEKTEKHKKGLYISLEKETIMKIKIYCARNQITQKKFFEKITRDFLEKETQKRKEKEQKIGD